MLMLLPIHEDANFGEFRANYKLSQQTILPTLSKSP
jgi:hypothetical protein